MSITIQQLLTTADKVYDYNQCHNGILMSDEGSRLQPENKGLNSGLSNTSRCKNKYTPLC